MRIRESAYMALACLFFVVYDSIAQTSVKETHNGHSTSVTSSAAITNDNWDIQFLSQPRLNLQGLQAGNRGLFSSITACDIYDFKSNSWQTHQFSLPRRGISTATAGQNAFFAGGSRGSQNAPEFVSRVDIYDAENNRWYRTDLSQSREVGAAGSIGNVVFFAGGLTNNGYSNRIDIFNTQNNQRRHHNLSEARTKLAAGVAGNKIVFAGGISGNTKSSFPSCAVDIYEVHSKTWATARLSESRYDISVASIGNKIFFAGGLTTSVTGTQPSNTIDIYDAVRNCWKKTTMSEAKHGMSVAVSGSKVYIAGGLLKGGAISDRLEVYDTQTDSWSVSTLPARRYGMAVGVTASRIVFAGGFINDLRTTTDRIEVLNIPDCTWSMERLSQPRANIATAVCGDKMIFAGGTDYSNTIATATADILQPLHCMQNSVYTRAANPSYHALERQAREWIFTDPENRDFIIADLWKYETQTVRISILNTLRQIVLTKSVVPFGDTKEQINIANLQQGQYWVLVECSGRKPALTKVNIGPAGSESTDKILVAGAFTNPDQLTSQY